MNRKESRMNNDAKTCKICGDKALGYNFNAITCESCKAFFRRNAKKNKSSRCPFEGNCSIDVITRRFCQSCRLRKCFEVGMKKEWILSDEEKRVKKAKIEENRLKRSTEAKLVTFESEQSPYNSQESGESWMNNVIAERTENNSFNCSIDLIASRKLVAKQNIEDATYEKLVEAEFTLLPTRNLLHTKFDKTSSAQLNAIEKEKLEELIEANEILKLPLSTSLTPDSSNGSFMDVIRMTDQAIRRIIQMAKKISGFRNLCQEDQVALLKGGCTELMILRSVMSYNIEKDCWQVCDANKCKILLKLDVLKQANVNLYEAHKKFINSFDISWRNDENIMLLLSAITLFTPQRPNIIHAELIKYTPTNYYHKLLMIAFVHRFEQYMYTFLLKRYLQSIHGSEGEIALLSYIRLMSRVDELHALNEDHVRIFLEINPNLVGPLLIEIFDLKD
ncbi:nuclear hormone receptor 48-like protein [Leptotrombidium deliense]|uniref:Nuclear hormone receptor 48-like protein n=1 Tax=Leptotrombidium deliense TaxID=299467 RepID=A0A443SSD3_9ACAR|nr:nuclear hormone receptor 48-like protein [Leptotrombidium deliense]